MLNFKAPSFNLKGDTLIGLKTDKKWLVKDQIAKTPDSTGGNFSVGYVVTDENQEEYFLKATDARLLLSGYRKKLKKIGLAFTLQQFERDLVDHLSKPGINRIVRGIDYGEIIKKYEGIGTEVFFIIFEKAKSDVRKYVKELNSIELKQIPTFVHNLAVGLRQIHKNDITHNDIKPSNFLYFDATLQKISDFGSATSMEIGSPNDTEDFLGDPNYFPPEAWGYKIQLPYTGRYVSLEFRKLGDLYMLGSMIYFFITGSSLNMQISSKMSLDHVTNIQSINFSDAIHYLNNIHGQVMFEMKEMLNKEIGEESTQSIFRLTNAVNNYTKIDPEMRGEPKNERLGLIKTDLQRLISHSNLTSKILGNP